MDLYQAQIIDLAKHPIHRGAMADATHTHSGVNVTCGDHVRIYVKVEEGEGRNRGSGTRRTASLVEQASWEGEGCAISVAAACLLTDLVVGKTVAEVRGFTNQTMFDLLGVHELGPARVKCAVLCLETLQGALKT